MLKGLLPVGILAATAVVAGTLGFMTGSAFKAAELSVQVTSLTREIGERNTDLATCTASIHALENAAVTAGRAREQAESIAAELAKRDGRVVYRVKEIKASSCVGMVNQLKGVSP